MSGGKKFAWVNIWMIVFAVLGLWLTVIGQDRTYTAVTLITLGLIVIVAIWRLPMSLYYQDGDNALTLYSLGRVYLNAWNQLCRQKWIWWLFGTLAVANAAGALIEVGMGRAYLKANPIDTNGIMGLLMNHGTSPLSYLARVLPWELPGLLTSAPDRFFPQIGYKVNPPACIFIALAVMALIPCIYRRLGIISRDSEYMRPARLLRSMLIPLAVVLCALVVGLAISSSHMYASLASNGLHPFSRFDRMVWYAWAIIMGLLIQPAFTAGVIGSLDRVQKHQAVDTDTLLKDVLRYFAPMVGVYAVIWIASVVAVFIPIVKAYMIYRLATVFLMFVPYAVVIHGTGVWKSFHRGVGDLFAHLGDGVSFIALGVTFITPGMILGKMIGKLASMTSIMCYVTSVVAAVINVGLTAFVLVAVWEFYVRITGNSAEAEP